MADIRIERRRGPGLWPWLVGLIVLVLLIWAIAELVNTDRDNKTMAADEASVPEANAAAPNAMAPPAPGAQPTAAPGAALPATERPGVGELGALLPLGAQDAGQTVSTGGTVLSKPAHGGFWLRSGENAVLWVKSEQKVKAGQQLPELTGTLEPASPGDVAAWLKDADVQAEASRHPGWQVTTQLYLVTTAGNRGRPVASDSAAAAPARQTRVARRR